MQPKYITAIGIPIYLAALTIMAKKLARARREPRFKRNDFYMGIDQTIAAFAIPGGNLVSLMINISKHIKAALPVDSVTLVGLLLNVGTVVIGFIFLFLVLSFHQDFE